MYFVTMCVQGMEHRFGRVENSKVVLNPAGGLVYRTWIENAKRYPDATLDWFIVMPNHLHAIVIIGADPAERGHPSDLSAIVGSFKSISTVEYGRGVRSGAFSPYDGSLWQRGYYDRVLRDDHDLDRARQYIEANPGRWTERQENSGPRHYP